MTGYDYTRAWFDFSFENPDLVTGNHAAVYLWNVELNNRLGWVEKFASPASQSMAAGGIKSYNTYKKVFRDLVEWGFIRVVTESKNQYTANIIALSNFDKALDKALDKAITTQVHSTVQSTSSIIKPTNQQTNKPTNAGEPAGEGEISKSKKPAKFNPLTVSLPFPSPAFKQAWADWITHLGEKRKPPTEKSTELQLKKLGKFSEAVAVAMINQSIEKGWQGLFDLKAEDLPRPTTPPPPDTQIDLPPDAALEQTRRKSHYENFVFGFPEYTGKKIDFPESLSVHHLPKGYYHDLRK